MTNKPNAWNEGAARQALADLSGPALIATLEAIELDDGVLDDLYQVLRDSESVLFRYPAKAREAKRDVLFTEISAWVIERRSAEAAQQITDIRQLIAVAENGYREILSSLNAAPFSKLPGERRLWAGLTRAAVEIDQVRQTAVAIPGKTLGASVQGRTSAGISTDVDGAAHTYSAFATVLIGMLARQNHWVQDDGHIIFPDRIEVTDEDLAVADDVVDLGVSWSRWITAENRARLWGGALEERDARPEEKFLPEVERLRLHHPSYGDVADWIAHQRLSEVTAQTYAETLMESNVAALLRDGDGVVPLPPDAFLSEMEAASAGLLFDFIALDPRDTTAYQGCTLLEWVRGYTLLSYLAKKAEAAGQSLAERAFLHLDRQVLVDHLVRVGLSSAAAEAFIVNTCMHVDSDDLFDCPLLACQSGSLILMTAAIVDGDPARIALSNLTRLEQRFKAKGKAFEKRVLKFFEAQGLSPYSIETRRGGEPFQYDVLLPWGRYLFVFECKNRGPSNLKPRLAYNLARDRADFRTQVKRQVEGLLQYPDMSIAVSGIDPREMTIVPIVLYSLPVADDGDEDETVHFADWSSLKRFFRDRRVHIKHYHRIDGKAAILHRIAIHDLWEGDAPTPERFAEELENPFQTELMLSRLEPFSTPMRFSKTTFGVTTEWNAGELDLARLSDFFRVDPDSVKALEREMSQALAQVRSTSDGAQST